MTSWIENDEEYHHAEHIEEHVCQGSTASLCVGSERSHECRYRGTDVLTHCQCCCLLETKALNVHSEEHQCDGHRGSRCLNNHSDDSANDDKEDDGKEGVLRHVCQQVCHHIANVHGGSSLLQERKTHEEERKTENKLTNALSMVLSVEYQWHANRQQGDGKSSDIHFEPHGRDNPCCDSSSDVCTHDDADGLRKRHQTSIHKTNYHHCSGT